MIGRPQMFLIILKNLHQDKINKYFIAEGIDRLAIIDWHFKKQEDAT